MARRAFKCSRCDRSFSMAAHLARHQNTIHGRGGGKKKAGAAGRMKRGPGRPKRRVGRPAGRRSTSTISRMRDALGDGAARLLTQMRDYYTELTSRRSSIESQLANIQSAITSLGGSGGSNGRRRSRVGRPAGRRGRRPGRPAGSARQARAGSLKEVIGRVLNQSSRPLTPRDIASGAIRAGYQTKGKDLSKAVSNALPQMRNIRRVGRGLYAA